MRSPHKWAKEIHAIADGKQTQWARDYNKPIEWNDFDPVWDSSPISSSDEIIWRIKPPEVAKWRKDMAKALEDGKVVEHLYSYGWRKSSLTASKFLDPEWTSIAREENYRIRPEKKPDVVEVAYIFLDKKADKGVRTRINNRPLRTTPNLKIIFDGETGEPISAEVLK